MIKRNVYNVFRIAKKNILLLRSRFNSELFKNNICEEKIIDGYLDNLWKREKISCISEHSLPKESEVQLSIIIPLYNSEKYINKCVDSFINQKTSYTYEVLLIDDGSKDRTREIALEYEKKYSGLIRVIEQKNQGISAARNTGIENSRGAFIGFVDHDDWVREEYVNELVGCALQENADIIKCGFSTVRFGDIVDNFQVCSKRVSGTIKNELFDLPGFIWGGIYKREIFSKVRFPRNYWYEDMITWILVYRQSKLLINIPKVLYFKLIHDDNASKKVWSEKDYKCIEQLYLAECMITDNRKLGLDEDAVFYQCMVQELSKMLSFRTRGLCEKDRVQVFLEAKNVLEKIYKEEYKDEMITDYIKLSEIVLKGKFVLWKYLM
ncbi:TPA: glycosyltransferase family 2 protein [Streptococcus suis]